MLICLMVYVVKTSQNNPQGQRHLHIIIYKNDYLSYDK